LGDYRAAFRPSSAGGSNSVTRGKDTTSQPSKEPVKKADYLPRSIEAKTGNEKA